jgi:hypothetical protein
MLVLLLWSWPACAARSVTFFLDGALIQRDETARNGYLEIPLPAAVRPESLRIRPVGPAQILRVQVVPKQPARKLAKELTAITERQEQLQDRLKALALREEIFKSAAKSQSAKAPRRTKTNPQPLATIRQGTDYAISQLEAVFQLQRTANRELKQLEEKKVRLSRDGQAAGSVARVWLTPAGGSVTATYLQSDRSWQPRYEIRADGTDRARFAVFPGVAELQRDEKGSVSSATVDQGGGAVVWPFRDSSRPLMVTDLPVRRKTEGAGPIPLLTLSLTNSSGAAIPAGEFSCYDDGVYQGRGALPLLEPGRTVELRCSNN